MGVLKRSSKTYPIRDQLSSSSVLLHSRDKDCFCLLGLVVPEVTDDRAVGAVTTPGEPPALEILEKGS